jgi:hypothetical protein
MATYQAYTDFTAQSRTVSALMYLYANLEQENGKRVELTPIVVFIAFSIESYLNSLGARHVVIWDELERLPWKSKVEILYKIAGRVPEWGEEPLQFATEVFKLRDKLAHGKPERILGPAVKDFKQADDLVRSNDLQPDWYRGITKEWVLHAKERFRLLMIHLGQLFDQHESDHLLTATGGIITDDEINT